MKAEKLTKSEREKLVDSLRAEAARTVPQPHETTRQQLLEERVTMLGTRVAELERLVANLQKQVAIVRASQTEKVDHLVEKMAA
jgi:uncharacterized coiled-coil protein SlyX